MRRDPLAKWALVVPRVTVVTVACVVLRAFVVRLATLDLVVLVEIRVSRVPVVCLDSLACVGFQVSPASRVPPALSVSVVLVASLVRGVSRALLAPREASVLLALLASLVPVARLVNLVRRAPVASLASRVFLVLAVPLVSRASRVSVVTLARMAWLGSLERQVSGVRAERLVFLAPLVLVVPRVALVLGFLDLLADLANAGFLVCRDLLAGRVSLVLTDPMGRRARRARTARTARMVRMAKSVLQALLVQMARRGQRVTAANQSCKCT